METTEVPLAGFGGSWVKAALLLSLAGSSDKMLMSSPTWQPWFYSYLRKEMQTMVISCSGKGLPNWDMYVEGQGPLPEELLLMLTGAAYAPCH